MPREHCVVSEDRCSVKIIDGSSVRTIVLEETLSRKAAEVFSIPGIMPELEINFRIGGEREHINRRKGAHEGCKKLLMDSDFFVSVNDSRFHADMLRERGLPERMLRGVTVPDRHRTNKITFKYSHDTIDLALCDAGLSIQTEEEGDINASSAEICAKIRLGKSNFLRGEIEKSIGKSYPDLGVLSKAQQELLEKRAGRKLSPEEQLVWFVTSGNNWCFPFHPEGDQGTLIKAKLDLRHGISVFNGHLGTDSAASEINIVNAEFELVYGEVAKLREAAGVFGDMKINGQRRLHPEDRTKGEIVFDPIRAKLKAIADRGGTDVLKKQMRSNRLVLVSGVPGFDM